MPLQRVDPYRQHGRVHNAMVRFARSRPGQACGRHVNPRIDPLLYRLTRGHYPFVGILTAPLRTTGAKSGQIRETQLTYFHDGSEVILVASNYGGSRHPGWFYNLVAHPECVFGGEHFDAHEVSDPDEYARLFGLAERVFSGYTEYRDTTEDLGRTIPIVRLTPR